MQPRDPIPSELAVCPAIIELSVQWGDQDAFGHVNNTVFFRWFESSRIAYLARIDLAEKTPDQGLGPILAAIGCNYRRQLRFPDTVLVGARVTKIGRTSVAVEHVLWSRAQGAVAADGQSTLVVFDYGAQRPHPVPPSLRAAIERLEGHSFPSPEPGP